MVFNSKFTKDAETSFIWLLHLSTFNQNKEHSVKSQLFVGISTVKPDTLLRDVNSYRIDRAYGSIGQLTS